MPMPPTTTAPLNEILTTRGPLPAMPRDEARRQLPNLMAEALAAIERAYIAAYHAANGDLDDDTVDSLDLAHAALRSTTA